MPYCVARNCNNRSFAKAKNQCKIEAENKTTFHLFPKKIERRRIWVDRMGLTTASLPKFAYLCSRHFSPESFDRMSAFKVRLKDDAVPNIGIQKNAVLQDICSVDIKQECSEEMKPSPSIDEVCESANKWPRIDSPSEDCKQKDVSCQTLEPPMCVDKATWVSNSLIASSPLTEHLRNIIKELRESHRKEIRLLKQTARRKEKRITALKSMMAELRKQKDPKLRGAAILIPKPNG